MQLSGDYENGIWNKRDTLFEQKVVERITTISVGSILHFTQLCSSRWNYSPCVYTTGRKYRWVFYRHPFRYRLLFNNVIQSLPKVKAFFFFFFCSLQCDEQDSAADFRKLVPQYQLLLLQIGNTGVLLILWKKLGLFYSYFVAWNVQIFQMLELHETHDENFKLGERILKPTLFEPFGLVANVLLWQILQPPRSSILISGFCCYFYCFSSTIFLLNRYLLIS